MSDSDSPRTSKSGTRHLHLLNGIFVLCYTDIKKKHNSQFVLQQLITQVSNEAHEANVPAGTSRSPAPPRHIILFYLLLQRFGFAEQFHAL